VVAPALDVGAVLPGEVLVVLVVVVVGVLEICVVVVAVVVEAAGLVGVVDPGAGADVVVAEEPGAVGDPVVVAVVEVVAVCELVGGGAVDVEAVPVSIGIATCPLWLSWTRSAAGPRLGSPRIGPART
jgi:hypothetical protein